MFLILASTFEALSSSDGNLSSSSYVVFNSHPSYVASRVVRHRKEKKEERDLEFACLFHLVTFLLKKSKKRPSSDTFPHARGSIARSVARSVGFEREDDTRYISIIKHKALERKRKREILLHDNPRFGGHVVLFFFSRHDEADRARRVEICEE